MTALVNPWLRAVAYVAVDTRVAESTPCTRARAEEVKTKTTRRAERSMVQLDYLSLGEVDGVSSATFNTLMSLSNKSASVLRCCLVPWKRASLTGTIYWFTVEDDHCWKCWRCAELSIRS